MALTVNRLGMSLMNMGRASDSVRFLDDVDLTLSLDSRSSSSQQMISVEIATKPIVFRASYRDITLISTIVNKAMELSSRPRPQERTSSSFRTAEAQITKSHTGRSVVPNSSLQPVGKARILTSREQVKLFLLTDDTRLNEQSSKLLSTVSVSS